MIIPSEAEARRILEQDALSAMVSDEDKLAKLRAWSGHEVDVLSMLPERYSQEYQDLAEMSRAPWGALVVSSLAEMLFVESYSNKTAWKVWRDNRMESRQVALHVDVLRYGLVNTYSRKVVDRLTDQERTTVQILSPRRSRALMRDGEDFPEVLYFVERLDKDTFRHVVVDDEVEYRYLAKDGRGTALEFAETVGHGQKILPAVRFTCSQDTEGDVLGVVEPLIDILRRLQQTSNHRLVAQHFTAHVVRVFTNLSAPGELKLEGLDDAEIEKIKEERRLMMAASNIVALEGDVKVSTLQPGDLSGLNAAHDSDLRDFSALSRVPPHYLLGQMANLSAEALAAAEASLTRQADMIQMQLGDAHRLQMRLWALMDDDTAGAETTDDVVRWQDRNSRSLPQVADALSKIAQGLGVPREILWERIPGFDAETIAHAKELAAKEDPVNQLMAQVGKLGATPAQAAQQQPAEQPGVPGGNPNGGRQPGGAA